MTVLSSPDQLRELRRVLETATRLPFIGSSIPGDIVEQALASARSGEVLNTYDFVDVICLDDSVGWQVKSTKESTPVTWKRAKIPNAQVLIDESLGTRNLRATQKLGDAIIEFCNQHAVESLGVYDLRAIGYARVVVRKNGVVDYFERELITDEHPQLFKPSDFRWEWSVLKNTKKKEQFRALHGFHRTSGERWWAWHGLGENQFHFTGEKTWWPQRTTPNSFSFRLPSGREKLSIQSLIELLSPRTNSSNKGRTRR